MRAAARRVFLFARGHEARAHHAGVELAAFADADAAQHGAIDAAFVVAEMQMRLRRPRFVLRAEAEVLRRLVGIDDLAGVHLPLRIPERLEFAERADQTLAEHLRQQRAARLTVAVFT